MNYRCFKAASEAKENEARVRSSSPLDEAPAPHVRNCYDDMHLRDFARGTSYPTPDYEKSKYDLDNDGDEYGDGKEFWDEDESDSDMEDGECVPRSDCPFLNGVCFGVPVGFSDNGAFGAFEKLSEKYADKEKRRSIAQSAKAAAVSAAFTAIVVMLRFKRKRGGGRNG